ncbi:TPA: TnsD family Tn7-like transposition protein [Klebsiella variicola]
MAIFRKHRKGFSALQHLIVWTSLRPGQHAGELISEAKIRQVDPASDRSVQLLPAEFEQKQQYRAVWLQALDNHGGAKAARQNGGEACYAWLYRHDRSWLMAANQARPRRQGNNSHVDWQARDRKLVRLLIRIGRDSEEDRSLPRRSRNWFLQQLPHRASVEHYLAQLPLCRTFLDRYAESVGEYQIRRLTAAMLEDVQTGITSRRWELEKRCGLEKSKMAPLTTEFIRLVGSWIE